MNTKLVAEKMWKEINENNLGAETGISLLERELKKCIEIERTEIVIDITENCWSFTTIPITMYFYSLWTLMIKPKYFFYLYFKSIQNKLSLKVKNRAYK